jgi:hypothetical protein
VCRGVCVGRGVGLSPRYNVVSTLYNVFNFIILLMFLLLNSI